MTSQLLLSAAANLSDDAGLKAVSALSARMSYVAMCLTICWGVLTATGWMERLTGRRASAGGHAVIATFALATGVTHGAAFLFMDERGLNLGELIVPFFGGGQARHALGILGLELMIAVGLTAAMQRRFARMEWLQFHRFAYLAVWLTAMHAWLGAAANGTVSTLWLGGITMIAPAITLTVLRFLPSEHLVRMGLVDDAPTEEPQAPEQPAPSDPPTERIHSDQLAEPVDEVRVTVDHVLCHHYGLCQAQAPKVFRLLEDGRLRYARNPEPEQAPNVRAAAHACPMRAIMVQGAEGRQTSGLGER